MHDERALRVRDLREALGLTQAELADRAGVSRQLVSAVEAGRNTPSVEGALGLARALGTTVEELFGDPPAAARSALGEDLAEGTSVVAARVGDVVSAASVERAVAAGGGWPVADGRIAAGRVALFPGATADGLLVLGCDPALGLAASLVAARSARRVVGVLANTGSAVAALAGRRCHAAVVHGPPDALPRPPVPVDRWQVARWQVGLAAPRAARRRDRLGAALAGAAPTVQREAGAASQDAYARALQRAGATLPRAAAYASSHLDAARLGVVLDAAAVTFEPAAIVHDMAFSPLETHDVQLWIAREWTAHPAAQALLETLTSSAFASRLAARSGYDVSACGRRLRAA